MAQENKLTGKGLNLSPDVANQLAWLLENPDEAREEGFFDYRVGLFSPEVTQDYLTLRGALLPRSPSEKQEEPAWEKLLQKYNITHVVIYDLDPTSTRRLQAAFQAIFRGPQPMGPARLQRPRSRLRCPGSLRASTAQPLP